MKYKILLPIVLLFIAFESRADFPIGFGRYKFIPGYNLYYAKGYWDKNRNYNDYSSGYFTSHYFSISGGYGLGRRLDFLWTLPFSAQIENNTRGDKQVYTTAGLADAKLGLSYFFNDFDNNNHVSLTGTLIIPLYQNIKEPYLGFQSFGGELKLGFSGNGRGYFKNPYYDIEFGVRQYFNSDGPTQLFANITGGIPLNDSWKLSGTVSGVNSISSAVFNAANIFNYNKSFDYVRIAANAGYTINDNISLWGGVYTDILGRSIGKGSGISLSAVLKF